MRKKQTITATAPDGTKVTRTTANTYTHAVLVGPSRKEGSSKQGWGAWSFNGRLDIATKEYNKAQRAWAGEADVVLVAVDAPAGATTPTEAELNSAHGLAPLAPADPLAANAAGSKAYQAARAAGDAAGMELHRPAYTAWKRAYRAHLAARKAAA